MSTQLHIRNPLIDRDPLPIESWEAWLERWGAGPLSFQEAAGLIHCAFKVPTGSPVRGYSARDRLCFMLNLADGWNGFSGFDKSTDSTLQYCLYHPTIGAELKSVAGLRKRLTEQAATVLAKHLEELIATKQRDADREDYWGQIFTHDVFLFFQEFFKVRKNAPGDFSVRNISRETNKDQTSRLFIRFLLHMNEIMWSWGVCNEEPDEPERLIRTRIENAKPWIAQVLCLSENLEFFQDEPLRLTEKCVCALQGIVFSTEGISSFEEVLERGTSLHKKITLLLMHREVLIKRGEEEERRLKEQEEKTKKLNKQKQIADARTRLAAVENELRMLEDDRS